MGSNRRYADAIDRRMDRHIRERELAPKIVSATPDQLDFEHDPPKEAEQPVDVIAWVGITSGTVRVEAKVTAWNKRGVRVECMGPDQTLTTVWLFRGAISPR